MKIQASSPEEYIAQLSEERQQAMTALRQVILKNLPEGFEETMSSGMIAYVVPKSIYPKGYHTNPKLPLPFLSIVSQKNSITIYAMSMYAEESLLEWFVNEYPKHSKTKLDMGKSCVHFKKVNEIPLDLVAELVQKVSVERWIELYEQNFVK